MSSLYDEITRRVPRKRRATIPSFRFLLFCFYNTEPASKVQRSLIPHSFNVLVSESYDIGIGDRRFSLGLCFIAASFIVQLSRPHFQ